MRFQVIVRARHQTLNRDEIASTIALGEMNAFKLRDAPKVFENWKRSVTDHLVCWSFETQGYTSISSALIPLYDLLWTKKKEIQRFNQEGGTFELYITIFSAASWGDTLTSDVLAAYGKAGIDLSFEVFLEHCHQ